MAPAGLALLPDGSLLIADSRNHRVRRVDPAGQIHTVAGTGRPGRRGDGGPASTAQLTRPRSLAAYADGSYLIVDGEAYARVRRVDATGRITTVAGADRRRSSQSCDRLGIPARSLDILSDTFTGGIAALPDGGFLIAADSLGYGYYNGGTMHVSGNGVVTGVLCASGAYPRRADGRDLHVSGRAVTHAFAAAPTGVAVDADGSIILGYGDTTLYLLASPGRSQRFAVAVAPGTLASVFDARVLITATDAASARVSVYRNRRLVLETEGQLQPGTNTLRLPRRLSRGVHEVRVRATTADGRTAIDGLRLLGRPSITIAYAKRRIRREFVDTYAGEGTGGLRLSNCRQHSTRRVGCRASFYFDYDIPIQGTLSIMLRPDGVLQYRRGSHGIGQAAFAITA
jgi:hypothetical protein